MTILMCTTTEDMGPNRTTEEDKGTLTAEEAEDMEIHTIEEVMAVMGDFTLRLVQFLCNNNNNNNNNNNKSFNPLRETFNLKQELNPGSIAF